MPNSIVKAWFKARLPLRLWKFIHRWKIILTEKGLLVWCHGMAGYYYRLFAVRRVLNRGSRSGVKPSVGENLLIITAADSSHYRSLRNFLCSLFLHEPDSKVVVFDLGLRRSQFTKLQRWYSGLDLRKFDYSQYPDYFNIKNISNGEYAWKPVIIADMLDEFKCDLCWMDAGTIILSSLDWLKQTLASQRLCACPDSRSIRQGVHPKTCQYLKADDAVLSEPMVQSGFVALPYQCKVRNLAEKWRQCALIKECIAPEGSDRSNHTQDQAVFSILMRQHEIPFKSAWGDGDHFRTRQDI